MLVFKEDEEFRNGKKMFRFKGKFKLGDISLLNIAKLRNTENILWTEQEIFLLIK